MWCLGYPVKKEHPKTKNITSVLCHKDFKNPERYKEMDTYTFNTKKCALRLPRGHCLLVHADYLIDITILVFLIGSNHHT